MSAKTTVILFVVATMFASLRVCAQTQTQNQDRPAQKIEHFGGGVSALPKLIYSKEPDFSDKARVAGYQGVCTLSLIVGVDGVPRNIRVTNPLGMGLDEKAIEAVRTWRFKPALKSGTPVEVEIAVQVDFHLYGKVDSKVAHLMAEAAAGDPKAELVLATGYFKGDQKGTIYLERAAKHGMPKAQFLMGDRVSRDASPDYAKYMWYTLAGRGGYKQGDKALKELTPKMTSEQVRQGQALADNWQNVPPT